MGEDKVKDERQIEALPQELLYTWEQKVASLSRRVEDATSPPQRYHAQLNLIDEMLAGSEAEFRKGVYKRLRRIRPDIMEFENRIGRGYSYDDIREATFVEFADEIAEISIDVKSHLYETGRLPDKDEDGDALLESKYLQILNDALDEALNGGKEDGRRKERRHR